MASTRAGVSRRSLLRGAGTVAFAGASVAALKLPFFEVPGAQQDPATCKTADLSASQKRLIISNWPGYIDPKRKATSTFQMFQQETGITVDYTDDVNDNAEFYAKVRNQLGSCEPIDRDMVMLTDWMAARMIGLGWMQPFDKAKVPNLHANLIDPLRNLQWDPDLTYHAPWQTGLTGIAYNAAKTGEVKTFQELLTKPELKGRITLLSEMRDTMGFMLRIVGARPQDFTQEQWEKAIEELRKAVAGGQVRAFTGNDYTQDLAAGNILACEAWSGDIIQLQFDNPDIKFVVPEEGLSLWSDNMIIPNQASHQANAEEWVNYYYDPEVAAKLAAWVNYICPVKGAREAMEKIDPSLVDNALIFPEDEDLADTFDFMPLDDRQTIAYERDWSDVIGG
ncbi:spermidine/putrescine ABC transporter substrate-binding protein [Nocardioides sp. InS609-2]|uniref:polyamine ABC transporter substrate-binding protein n=1 Tax=Nocardioides sp. InS609-2 TaxID=2760705 RepID=UPI00180D0CA1|nr:spermidine/putrescine ABC transporter substrate-binding protein [Nocardioides sp. InS609-2]MBA3781922.1 extracellular solute-binding protein [Nocardioides sp.]